MANNNIDSLEVQITSNTQSASRAIDTLIKNVERLGGVLDGIGSKSSGLAKLATSVTTLSNAMKGMKDSGVGTADFTRLVKNMESIASINSAGIEATASSISKISASLASIGGISAQSKEIADFASNLSKLGSKSTSQAIANMPQLAAAMKDLFTTLSTAPEISESIIRMTDALARFVAGAKTYVSSAKSIGSVSTQITSRLDGLKEVFQTLWGWLKKLATGFKYTFMGIGQVVSHMATGVKNAVSKIKNYASATSKAQSVTSSFASAVGTLYVKFWLLARVLGKVWGSVESSMDYLETVNYFNASFEQIANNAVGTMSEAGYDSAEAYYDSFTEKAKSLTAKMTGFTIDGGNLVSTGNTNLGLDAQQTLQYQTLFAQMSNSMGVASDKAVTLSNVLTEIGADLASVKNMNFEDVWQDMASGLTGKQLLVA